MVPSSLQTAGTIVSYALAGEHSFVVVVVVVVVATLEAKVKSFP